MEIILQKDKGDGIHQWKVNIHKNTYTVEFGKQGGKLQTKLTTITKAKNEGRSNYSSIEDQAILRAVNKARRKLTADPEYQVIKGEDLLVQYTNKEVKEVCDDVPKPMLAVNGNTPKEIQKLKKQYDTIFVQPKLDGFRGISKDGNIYSRSRKEMTNKIPHLSKYLLEVQTQLGGKWLDGELYSNELTFNEIQSILLKKPAKMTAEDFKMAEKMKFNLFDYVDSIPANARIQKLEKLQLNEFVTRVPSYRISIDEIKEYHDQFIEEGHEGLMIRTPDGPYEFKRSKHLLKWKVFLDVDVEIVGVNPERDDPTKLGTLIVKAKIDGKMKTFTARPAVTHEVMDDIMKRTKKYIGMYGVVKYQGLDEKTGAPRFGIFRGFRSPDDMGE